MPDYHREKLKERKDEVTFDLLKTLSEPLKKIILEEFENYFEEEEKGNCKIIRNMSKDIEAIFDPTQSDYNGKKQESKLKNDSEYSIANQALEELNKYIHSLFDESFSTDLTKPTVNFLEDLVDLSKRSQKGYFTTHALRFGTSGSDGNNNKEQHTAT